MSMVPLSAKENLAKDKDERLIKRWWTRKERREKDFIRACRAMREIHRSTKRPKGELPIFNPNKIHLNKDATVNPFILL